MKSEKQAINEAALRVAKHSALAAREAMTEAENARSLAVKEAEKTAEANAQGRAGNAGYHAYEAVQAADQAAAAAKRASRHARYAQEAAEWISAEAPEAAEANEAATQAAEYAQAANREAATADRKTAMAETTRVAVTISELANETQNTMTHAEAKKLAHAE